MIEKLLDQPYWNEVERFIDGSDLFSEQELIHIDMDKEMIEFTIGVFIKKYLCFTLSEPESFLKIHKNNVLNKVTKDEMKQMVQNNLEFAKRYLLHLMTENLCFSPGEKYASLWRSNFLAKRLGSFELQKDFFKDELNLEEIVYVVSMVIIGNSSFMTYNTASNRD